MKETNDIISVIVPIYKVENYLDECISSIVNQTYQKMQIILVDDGSPDRCGDICDKWAERDHRIMVIHKENGGLSDARNVGIDAATGEFIAFVDSDDWIEINMLEILLDTLKKEKADIVACGIIYAYTNKKEIHSCPYSAGTPDKYLKWIYQDSKFPVASWNKLYRKELWDNFRFPKGKICEDAFTTYLLLDKASKIVQVPNALYYYRIRENSIMTSRFSTLRMDEEEAWRKNYLFMEAHYPQIAKAAYSFYLQKVRLLFHTIPVEQYTEFESEHNYLKSILKNNLSYILCRSGLNWKYKIRYLIDVLRIK